MEAGRASTSETPAASVKSFRRIPPAAYRAGRRGRWASRRPRLSHSSDVLERDFSITPRVQERKQGRQQFGPPSFRLPTVHLQRPRIRFEDLHRPEVNHGRPTDTGEQSDRAISSRLKREDPATPIDLDALAATIPLGLATNLVGI